MEGRVTVRIGTIAGDWEDRAGGARRDSPRRNSPRRDSPRHPLLFKPDAPPGLARPDAAPRRRSWRTAVSRCAAAAVAAGALLGAGFAAGRAAARDKAKHPADAAFVDRSVEGLDWPALVRGVGPLTVRHRRTCIAVCIVGGLRTFANPNVYTTLLVNGVHALQRGGATADAFLVLLDDGAPASNIYGPSAEAQFRRKLDFRDEALIERAIAAFAPVRVERVAAAGCENAGVAAAVKCCALNVTARHPSAQLQNYWVDYVLQNVLDYEKFHDLRYDWVARFRPDLVVLEPLPAVLSLAKRRFYLASKTWTHANVWDAIYLVPRGRYTAVFDAFRSSLHHVYGDACAHEWGERQLEAVWRKQGAAYQAFPFAVALLRGSGDVECSYLRDSSLSVFRSAHSSVNGTAVDHAAWCRAVSQRIKAGDDEGKGQRKGHKRPKNAKGSIP
ncbi:hypothetical protein M885DRAFT_615894 [Pelagophyceae sp. CCMP2097]|nr:hypothetical protein M885DRAFT_615894 [Pelagophyceae sp. CCMP2097]